LFVLRSPHVWSVHVAFVYTFVTHTTFLPLRLPLRLPFLLFLHTRSPLIRSHVSRYTFHTTVLPTAFHTRYTPRLFHVCLFRSVTVHVLRFAFDFTLRLRSFVLFTFVYVLPFWSFVLISHTFVTPRLVPRLFVTTFPHFTTVLVRFHTFYVLRLFTFT